jgi:hypothetical protein
MNHAELTAMAVGHQNTLDPFREYLEWHFMDAELVKLAEKPQDEDGYLRRPLIGLRLQLPDNMTLAIRPGWTPKYNTFEGDKLVAHPGKLKTYIIELELLGPGKLLRLRLQESMAPRIMGSIYVNSCRKHLQIMVETARDLLLNPTAVFARQADKCCCCGRSLDQVESRTRGIGPECLRMFSVFSGVMKAPTAVERYRQEYRQQYEAATGFLPGR